MDQLIFTFKATFCPLAIFISEIAVTHPKHLCVAFTKQILPKTYMVVSDIFLTFPPDIQYLDHVL